MDKPSDYIRIPGPKRRYRHIKTGKEISRWRMQTIQAAGVNPRKRATERKKVGISTKAGAKQKRFNALVNAYKTKTAKKKGISRKAVRVRGQSKDAVEFRASIKKLSKLTDRQLENKDADGVLAQILVDLGLRDPEWDMPVGESPS